MRPLPNIILIGPMGAGKTTIGKLLAHSLKREFLDSDHYIEHRCGANIPWIFDVEGEHGFRDRETASIDELTQRSSIVLATGGGAIMREENRQILRERGVVVYLATTIEQQIRRTSRDRNRPLLQNANPEQVLRDLFALRDPLYRATADIVVKTDRRSPRGVVNDIVRRAHRLATPLASKS